MSKLIPSIQIPKQEATRARRLHNEKLVVTELNRGKLTLRAPHAPQEILHEYLKKKKNTYQHQFRGAIEIFLTRNMEHYH